MSLVKKILPLAAAVGGAFCPDGVAAEAAKASARPGPAAPTMPAIAWRALPALPDREGFAGSYAGVSGGALIVAGGANFPVKRPWEGGAKAWYDHVFVLDGDAREWRAARPLPQAGGYGVALTVDDAVILIGGGEARQNFTAVWRAHWDGKRVSYTAWPALPKPLAMAAGAQVGRTLYLAGGLDRPDATQAQKIFLALDLEARERGWRELEAWPGAERFLATAGGDGDAFFLFSGARLVTDAQGKSAREWLRDAWRYAPREGWKRLADLPRVAVAAPTPAPLRAGKFLVLGGDDGAQVSVAPAEHRGFPREVLAYDPARDAWARAGEVPFSIVTTTATTWRGEIVIPGGEARPGVRTPAVWAGK